MSIKISQDYAQENKINSESPDINKKFIGSVDKKDGETTSRTDLHNSIHNQYLSYIKTGRTMSDSYFKATMSAIYSDIYKKNLVWKNLTEDADIQINLKKILNNFSFVKSYDILKYYSEESGKGMLDDTALINLTGMVYATLYNTLKDGTPTE